MNETNKEKMNEKKETRKKIEHKMVKCVKMDEGQNQKQRRRSITSDA